MGFTTEATSPRITDEEPTANNSNEASAKNTANNSNEASTENYIPLDFQELHHSDKSKFRCDSYKEAATKLQKQAKIPIHPVPSGEPLFLFSSYKGKSKDLNLFWDIGCSHVVFEEGVPGKELDGVITQNGPFNIGGIGDNSVKANDEWLCTINTMDGQSQFLHGLTIDRLCGNMPVLSLEGATKEIKDAAKKNTWVQNARTPNSVGGHVDILVGIKYNRLFPHPKFELECGLTIYELRVGGVNGYNAAIGGPHESFNFLRENAGNTAGLLAFFTENLASFRTVGPPSLKNREIDWNYEDLAQKMNRYEAEAEINLDDSFEEKFLEGNVFSYLAI